MPQATVAPKPSHPAWQISAGEKLFDLLTEPHTKQEAIEALSEQTGTQWDDRMFEKALEYIRDVFARTGKDDGPQVIVCLGGMYCYAETVHDVVEYLLWNIRYIDTRTRRLQTGTIAPALKKFGRLKVLRDYQRNIKQLRETSNDLVSDLVAAVAKA